ncbi:MAG: hypothetical protein ACRDYW_12470 [Acidimicrobiales bacterium]
MRFDELILQDEEGELRVRFHPELTVLSGLGATERRALAEGILSSVVGGTARTTLRYLDAAGHPITLEGQAGQVSGTRDDGAPAAPPLRGLGGDPVAARSLMLLGADDLGVPLHRNRDDEPPELREARDMLEVLTEELRRALDQQSDVAELQAELDRLDDALRVARDGLARREYAQVLAQLERVRAEAAAVQSGRAGIEADQHLLSNAAGARKVAELWVEATTRLTELAAALDGQPRLDPEDRDVVAQIPAAPPARLTAAIDDLRTARVVRDRLDERLQALSIAQLPAPSDPLVADLGVLDQGALWVLADRLASAEQAMQRVQVSLGGLEVEDLGPAPAVIEEIEEAHRQAEEADRAADAAKLPGLAGAGLGVAAGVVGVAAAPLLLPVGLVGAAVAAGAGVVRPRARRAKAHKAEQAALGRADATSYLGFHIRRVEASVDPHLRETVEATTIDLRDASQAWTELAGGTELARARALRPEIEAYNEALRNLGETADELEQLRRQLDDVATPAVAVAHAHLREVVAPYLLGDDDLDDLAALEAAVRQQCRRGMAARAQAELDDADVDEQKATARLDDLLLQLGFDAGPLDARVGALEWAITRASEREAARRRARPLDQIKIEIEELQAAATTLRRPEWATVTAADAATPDIGELEERRTIVLDELTAVRGDVDIERLADRHAAVERRVASLEARLGGHGASSDPGAIADIQQHLLAHLATASQAGPDGDPVPVVLDDALQRVPADRKWDLLDLVLRLAERHQLVYLSDDAFVAAWARQRALDGAITLLELAPETV